MTATKHATTPRNINDLLSPRVHSLSQLHAACTALRVERKYGLGLLEWRAIAHLGGFAPLSLKELARRASLDKSYASRTVAALIDRGLVNSERNDADARGVRLSLTPAGATLYEEVFADASMRNERLLKSLTATQRKQLAELLDLVLVNARKALDDERRIVAGELDDLIANDTAAPAMDTAKAPPPPDLSEARYLISRLQDLIGRT